MAQVLRLYVQMFLSYGLNEFIILETAHHRTTFGICCNITQNTTPEENSQKMFIFLHQLYFYLMGRSRIFLEVRIKFPLRRTKGRGKRGYGGETQNEAYVWKIPIIKQDTNYFTNQLFRLLITTIAIGMTKILHAGIFKWFWAVPPGHKQLCVFLRNKYCYQIGNAIKKQLF